ncbi:MAG: TonB-dependent receptor [Flavobacteriales bacterium]|nr:TonB-dependent receptor [Flavobacteriales bacterium]
MMKKLLTAITGCILSIGLSFGQGNTGELRGTVKDGAGRPVPFVNVVVLNAGQQVAGGATDIDGNYSIKPIVVGTYSVKVTSIEFAPKVVSGVNIQSNKIQFLDVTLEKDDKTLGVVEIEVFKEKLIDPDQGVQGTTWDRKDIAKLPSRDAIGVAQVTGGVNSRDGELSLRGSRGDALIFIDGVKTRGRASLPQGAVQEVQIILGGVPADIGDATGGIIQLQTRGVSPVWFGGVEARTSQFLDAFGNHLFQATVGGPLISKKVKSGDKTVKEPIVGFLFSAESEYFKDPRPARDGFWKLKDDVRAGLLADPLRRVDDGTFFNSQYLRQSDFERVRVRQNSGQWNTRGVLKFDFMLAKNTTFTVGANGNYVTGRGGNGGGVGYAAHPMNFQNAGTYYGYDFNVYGKFIQRFANADEKDGKTATVKNAFIQLQVDYSKAYARRQDPRHKGNLFNYGYVGEFNTLRTPTYQRGTDPTTGFEGWLLNGFQETLVQFTPSNLNPELTAYTNDVYAISPNPQGIYDNFDNLIKFNALRNGDQPGSAYTIWDNPGGYYNAYGYNDNNQFRALGMGALDIKNHSIKIGFEFEQRRDNFYQIAPGGLWTIGRQLTNAHIRELDFNNPLFVTDEFGVYQDTINYDRLYSAEGQANFDYNLRQKLGLNPTGLDFINFDSYAPSTFSLDMFSADELLNNGNNLVNYFGYDVYGKKLRGNWSLEDFFNKKDDNGQFSRNIGAFQPVYISGYIMDKFAFRDLIFNAGVRIDRYDANQRVLRDPYTLYATRTRAEVNANHPSNIGDNYAVYVSDLNSATPTILGYRNGDTWYNAQGQEINDLTVLRTSTGIVQPYLVNPNENVNSGNFDVNASFADYKPQVNVMPRVAFSFPISDQAIFTAHYDVLVQRPLGGGQNGGALNMLNPLDYYFWNNSSYNGSTRIFNNPALRPEKTIDFSLGFQQALGDNSSLKLTAYYREIRDQIQVVRVNEAYPNSYFTYRNIDFGTTKGLTLTYDLRRVKNVRMTASYTLQFADGTGADNTSAFNLVNFGQPNLRVLIPLNLDQRHQFNVYFDFGYGKGRDYNGPVIRGKNGKKDIQVLSNAGITATLFGGSGFPYSRSSTIVSEAASTDFNRPILEGSINGSRLPWQFNADVRVYKQFDVMLGKKDKPQEERKSMNMEVYLQVLNIFNFKNTIGVYRYSGNADDDGFLLDPQTQPYLNNILPDADSFREMYSMKISNPYNFSQPRRIRLGLIMNF